MRGKTLRIICVGKVKTPWWLAACEHYSKMIGHWRRLEIVEARDGVGEPAVRNLREGQALAEKLEKGEKAIALCENGEAMTSRQFANVLRQFDESGERRLNFIIGGPYGLDDIVMQKCRQRLSLSPMTLSHELARLILLEQIYRAESILRGLPYHH